LPLPAVIVRHFREVQLEWLVENFGYIMPGIEGSIGILEDQLDIFTRLHLTEAHFFGKIAILKPDSTCLSR
jgi:hypothetical protein